MVLTLLACYLVYLVLGVLLQRYVVFPAYMAEALDEPGEGIEGLERLWLQTDQGRVEGWFVPGAGVGPASPGPVVFFTHGNAEVIDYWPYVLRGYLERGISLALLEYRGYGRSAGSPSQRRLTDDAVRFYDTIVARPDVAGAGVIFHGRSIGSGVACAVASRRETAALILQSPFVSLRRMMARFLIPPFLCLDPFDNAAVIRDHNRPVLIVHGERDEVIPFSQGKALADSAPNATFKPYDCGHNDFPIESARFWNDVDSFLQRHGIIEKSP